jgi:hypothetical protein
LALSLDVRALSLSVLALSVEVVALSLEVLGAGRRTCSAEGIRNFVCGA